MLIESVMLETDPDPVTCTTGPLPFTVAVISSTIVPEALTRSTVPGALVVPPGLSSHVQSTEKLTA
jgi:hypothetical protein